MGSSESGFSAAELLVTLFIGALFLIAGYQIWGYVSNAGGEANRLARASNIAYDELQKNAPASNANCSTTPAIPNETRTVDGLGEIRIITSKSCPYGAVKVSKTTVTVEYEKVGSTYNQKVVHATLSN